MLQVLIGIIVIALIVVIGLAVYQRRTAAQVASLTDRLTKLDQADLKHALSDDQAHDLMGSSLKTFKSLQETYQTQVQPAIKDARDQLSTVQTKLHGTGLLSLGSQLNQLTALVAQAEKEQAHLTTRLDQAAAQAQEQADATLTISDQLATIRHRLDEHAYEYGAAIKPLQARQAALADQYDHFSEIAEKGDHEAASELLTKLTADLANYQKLVKAIPQLYQPLFATFPDQLAELKQGYQRLVADHYRFPLQAVDEEVDRLEAERQHALDQLANLDLPPVQRTNQHLAKRIEELYAMMQTEIDDRPQVQKLVKIVGSHLDHARRQNRELLAELERLSESYTLNHDELANARALEEQLKQLQRAFERDQIAVNAQSAIASEVLTRFNETEQTLTAIEVQQQQINSGVADLQDDEARARKALTRFVATVRATKRHIENQNLPGLPQDYVDYFFTVSDEIDHLTKAINQPKINMEQITKQLLTTQTDISKLITQTDKLRDAAELTAQLTQYALRLVSAHPEIDAAIQAAQDHYDQYEYEESLETIGAALEKVEPGSFKRLEDHYYGELDQQSAE